MQTTKGEIPTNVYASTTQFSRFFYEGRLRAMERGATLHKTQ
jgi:hypothetical protein